jgi:hypothetical protein
VLKVSISCTRRGKSWPAPRDPAGSQMGMATETYSFQVQGELWSKVVVGLTLTILDIVVLVGGQKLEELKTVGQWWGCQVGITCLEVRLNYGKGECCFTKCTTYGECGHKDFCHLGFQFRPNKQTSVLWSLVSRSLARLLMEVNDSERAQRSFHFQESEKLR